MDWINQNRLKNGLIAALLALNLITLSIIWMRTSGNGGEQDRRPSESASLMKTALNLSDKQTEQFSNALTDFHERTKPLNDRLTTLKKHLAEELFSAAPDTSAARATASEIGELQAGVELERFRHFRDFLAVCTPEQREKLRPILTDLFGRRPPREDPRIGPRRGGAQQDGPDRERPRREGPADAAGRGFRDSSDAGRGGAEMTGPGSPAPPSIEEKLVRYSARLGLSAAQQRQVRAVLEDSRRKGEELRSRTNPDRDAIDAEKEKIRRGEDERIRGILDDRQRAIFETMTANRGRPPR